MSRTPRDLVAESLPPVVLLGASTGGWEALTVILAGFPADAPPVVCVQHIPAVFSGIFAHQLALRTCLRVTVARSDDVLERGHAYVAPGGKHLQLCEPHGTRLHVYEGPPVNRQRPSIDATFISAAQRIGWRTVAALLSGLGEDGADGLGAIRDMGGFTLAQDETTSVAFEMPKEAMRRGAAIVVAPLEQIAGILLGAAARRNV